MLKVLCGLSRVFGNLNSCQAAGKQRKKFLQLQTLSQPAGWMLDLVLWGVNKSSSLQYFHCYRQEGSTQGRNGYSQGVLRLQCPKASPRGQNSSLGTRRFWLQPDFLGFHSFCHLWAVSSQASPAQIELNIKLTHTEQLSGLSKSGKTLTKQFGCTLA